MPTTMPELGYARPIAQVPDASTGDPLTAGHRSALVRRLLHRRELAAARHRAGMARKLGMSEIESAAVFHIAHHGELSQVRLSELLDLSSGGTAALVQRLEQDGHAVRRQAEDDRRVRLISLSPAMAAHVTAFYGPLIEEIDQLLIEAADAEPQVVRFLEALAEASELHANRAWSGGSDLQGPPPPLTPALWG